VHQLGFLYADGSLLRAGRRVGLWLAGGGLTGVIALSAFGPYPVSMVGMPGERVSNMAPPTVALLAHLWVGWTQPAAGSSAWWVQRPLWLPAFALATAALVAVFR